MPALRIVPVNAVDSATLAASPSFLATMPLDNLKLIARDRVARSGALSPASSQVITGHWGGDGRSISSWGFFRHNGNGGAKARLELFSDLAMTSSLYDSGALDMNPSIPLWGSFNWGRIPWGGSATDPLSSEAGFFKFLSTTYYPLAFRITITNATLYFEASRMWLGEYLEAPFDPDVGFKLGHASATQRQRSRGGSRRPTPGDRWRTMEFNMWQAADADRAIWLDVFARCDYSDFVISVYPTASGRQFRDHLMNCGFADIGSNVVEAYSIFNQPFTLEEN